MAPVVSPASTISRDLSPWSGTGAFTSVVRDVASTMFASRMLDTALPLRTNRAQHARLPMGHRLKRPDHEAPKDDRRDFRTEGRRGRFTLTTARKDVTERGKDPWRRQRSRESKPGRTKKSSTMCWRN